MSRKKKIYKKKGNVIKDLTRNIFKILNEDSDKHYNYKQIAGKLDISDTDGKTQILQKLAELTGTKKIKEIDRGKYQINEDRKYHIGTLDVTSSGNGYFISDDFEKDIFIPSNNLGKGLQNDTVKAYIYKRNRSNKLEADIVEIIERDKTAFVGVLQMSKNFGFVVCDNQKMYADIFVSKARINGAEHGDKVQATITDWPENSKNPFGKITQVLGKPGDHNTEIHSILLEYGLPYEFEKEVEEDASKLSLEITKDEISKRRDMRKDLTFTIDPKDAKDFDDALSFTKLENGNYEIGIHIADVSHYVQPNTILDDEAYSRATSVYLVDRVVPMLPEMLSNGACSLRPNEEKLTFSAVFEINEKLLPENHDLNDRLKENKTEVASFLQASPVKDLKKAIGINDRYLFINELFRGDEDRYERSIKTINGFSIYVEAEYWIQRELIVKIGWNENAENVQTFIQLVKRRFS